MPCFMHVPGADGIAFFVSYISDVFVVSVLKCALVCPMYTLSRDLHFAPYAPLFSYMFFSRFGVVVSCPVCCLHFT